MKKSIFLIIGLLFGLYAFGQQDRNKWRLGLHSGIISYKGDINNEWLTPNNSLNNLDDNLDYLSYGISLEKNLTNDFGIRLSYTDGQFTAFDRSVNWDNQLQVNADNFSRALNVRTELLDWSLLLTYAFDNGYLLPADAIVAPYLTAGIGYTEFQTYGDLLRSDNARYYYWADGTIRDVDEFSGLEGQEVLLDGNFETKLSDIQTEGKKYETHLFHATAGIGLKVRLGARFNLNLETLLRFTNSDYLDDVSGDYLLSYDNEFQNYAAVPGTQLSGQRGNSNGNNDAYAFTSLSLHYNFGRKRERVYFPEIRIGLLSDPEIEKSEVLADTLMYDDVLTTVADTDNIEETIEKVEAPIDTQAIYVIRERVDTTFLLTTLDTIHSTMTVDTIQLIGDSIYILDSAIDSINFSSDQFWVEQHLVEGRDSSYALDSIALLVQDTQLLFVVREQIDTLRLLRDAQLMDSILLAGNIEVDTFYQVGDTLLKSNLEAPITEEDWDILRPEVIDIKDSLEIAQSYEAYLIAESEKKKDVLQLLDTALTIQDTTVLDSITNLVTVESIQDTIITDEISIEPPVLKDSIISEVVDIESTKANAVDTVLLQRISQMQMELDSLKETRKVVESNQEIAVESIPLSAAPLDTSKDKTVTLLMDRVAQLEQSAQQRDKEEISQLKAQIAEYEAREQERLSLENTRLRSEILELRNANSNPTPVVIPAPAASVPANTAEMNQLRSEVANMNQNMELMKQLLLQQQLIASMNKQPAPVVDTTDDSVGTAAELALLRAELAELKTGIKQQDTIKQQQPLVVTMPVKGDKAEVDSLRNELFLIRQELNRLKNAPSPEPIVEKVMVEVPVEVEKPLNVASLIKGRNQQIVFFTIGSSKLSSASQVQVQSIVELLEEYPELEVKLDAFTDASGDASRNLALSKKRAESVKAALMRSGISSQRIQMNFNGEDETNDQAFGRRVEIKAFVPLR